MRTYVNMEREQIETVLDLFVEIQLHRRLTRSEKFVKLILNEALDKSDKEW
jgi:hypothetical protein